MKAEDYLEQVRNADAMIDSKKAEKQELWALATSMTQASDGMPHASGVSDKVAAVVAKIIAKNNLPC